MAITATQDIREQESVDPEVIDHITVTVSPGAADALNHTDPTTGLEAKFSMEYCVASAAVRDRIDLGTFDDDAIDDPAVQRVTHRTDSDLAYDAHESRVRIETDSGATYDRGLQRPPGKHTTIRSRPRSIDGSLPTVPRSCSRNRSPPTCTTSSRRCRASNRFRRRLPRATVVAHAPTVTSNWDHTE